MLQSVKHLKNESEKNLKKHFSIDLSQLYYKKIDSVKIYELGIFFHSLHNLMHSVYLWHKVLKINSFSYKNNESNSQACMFPVVSLWGWTMLPNDLNNCEKSSGGSIIK